MNHAPVSLAAGGASSIQSRHVSRVLTSHAKTERPTPAKCGPFVCGQRARRDQNSANCAGLRCLSAGQLVTGPATRSTRTSRRSSAATARANAWAMSCSTARRCHTRPGVGTGARRAGAGWVCRMCSGVCSRMLVSPWACWPSLTGQRHALCRARIPNPPPLRVRARRAGHTLRWSLRRRAPSTRPRSLYPRPRPTSHRPACGGNRAP